MILSEVGMLAAATNRTRLYLQRLVKNKLLPALVLLMEDSSQQTSEGRAVDQMQRKQGIIQYQGDVFDLDLPVRDYLEAEGIPYQVLPSLDPNNPEIVSAVAACSPPVLIYSGPGGAILRKDILSTGKRFLHIHPGFLPGFGGSTTIYYSLIKENHCGVSAIFLTDRIDAGPIIRCEIYPPPEDRTTIDLWYDPFIRSDFLIKVLKEYLKNGKFESQPQPDSSGETYYIIHPVLKHIAILSS
jgi:methionyl-tRNA formyltransferase